MAIVRQPAIDAVRNSVTVPLNQDEFDALVSLACNIGVDAFSRSTLVRELNAGHTEAAANQFAVRNRSGGQVVQGLVNRRAAEANLFRTPMAPLSL